MVDPSATETELGSKPSSSCDFRGKCRNTLVLYAFLGIVIAGLIFQYAVYAWQSIHIAFAEEQTKIFDQMVSEAIAVLEQSPPNVSAAVGYLEYLHNYYPSGTKQAKGTKLDRIVERSRTQAERFIIEKLREVTETDLGNNADAWIQLFRKNKTNSAAADE